MKKSYLALLAMTLATSSFALDFTCKHIEKNIIATFSFRLDDGNVRLDYLGKTYRTFIIVATDIELSEYEYKIVPYSKYISATYSSKPSYIFPDAESFVLNFNRTEKGRKEHNKTEVC